MLIAQCYGVHEHWAIDSCSFGLKVYKYTKYGKYSPVSALMIWGISDISPDAQFNKDFPLFILMITVVEKWSNEHRCQQISWYSQNGTSSSNSTP